MAFDERKKAFTKGEGDILVESVESIVLATMRACQSHPEWAQAALLTTSVPDIIDEIATALVEGMPIERMAV